MAVSVTSRPSCASQRYVPISVFELFFIGKKNLTLVFSCRCEYTAMDILFERIEYQYHILLEKKRILFQHWILVNLLVGF